MSVALHPSERAMRRQRRVAVRRRQWLQAARIAGGIVGAVALAIFLVTGFFAARSATAPAAGPLRVAATPSVPAAMTGASPGLGTTGTIALPPVPQGTAASFAAVATASAVAGIVPAAPFRLRSAPALARARALECLAAAIYYEAASEPDDGQRAVAQVVLNRTRHPAFPASVCGVVYQGAGGAKGCQFSFACDGAMARVPSRSGWARASRIAAAALEGYVFAPVGLATHYHTYAVTPAWNRTLVMTDAIGAHFFHRWKGYWGTAAAFGQRYAGYEPLPGPPVAAPVPVPVIAVSRPVPVTPATVPATVQPAYRDSGTVQRTADADALPAQSQILERWKDSGKPIR